MDSSDDDIPPTDPQTSSEKNRSPMRFYGDPSIQKKIYDENDEIEIEDRPLLYIDDQELCEYCKDKKHVKKARIKRYAKYSDKVSESTNGDDDSSRGLEKGISSDNSAEGVKQGYELPDPKDWDKHFKFHAEAQTSSKPVHEEEDLGIRVSKPDSHGFVELYYTGSDSMYKPTVRVLRHEPDADMGAMRDNILNGGAYDDVTTQEILRSLNDFSAQASLRKEILSVMNYARIFKQRRDMGLKVAKSSLHMVFSGNPGTGKTYIARLIGGLLYQVGFLSEGHVLEVDRSHLTGEYIGWSESKTKLICEAARGGVLFIDEAYSLTDNQYAGDFGYDAINVLTKAMEDYAGEMVVIAAGYKDKMANFLLSNPGLRSRFFKVIDFKDFTPSDMTRIFDVLCAENDYVLEAQARDKLTLYFKSIRGLDLQRFGNARGVRTYFENTIKRQAERLVAQKHITREEYMAIKAEDIISGKILSDESVTYFPRQ